MALLTTFNTGKGIKNTNTGKTWRWTGKDYVPYIDWSDLGPWYVGSLLPLDPTTTYDLSGFQIGHEVSMRLLIIENTGPSQTVSYRINIYRKLTTGVEELLFSYSFLDYIESGQAYRCWRGTGIDYDEEWDGIQYMKYEAVVGGVTVDEIYVTYTNIGNYQALVTTQDKSGSFWVEGKNIAFIDYGSDGNRYAKHLIRNDGTIYSTGKTPGMIWVDQINHGKIGYIDQYGNERKTYLARNYWGFEQLPTGKTPGYICVDREIYSYLSFVGYDGKVYCIINGPVVGYENGLLP